MCPSLLPTLFVLCSRVLVPVAGTGTGMRHPEQVRAGSLVPKLPELAVCSSAANPSPARPVWCGFENHQVPTAAVGSAPGADR